MTDMTTQLTVRQAEHDELARLMAQWEANPKNKVEHIPVGAMKSAGWTPRQTINPQAVTAARIRADKAEHEARRRAEAAIPYGPKSADTSPRTAGTIAGTQKAKILELLADGQALSARDIAERIGASREVVNQQLAQLRDRGRITSSGPRHAMVWRIRKAS